MILDRADRFLARFVAFPSDQARHAVTLWVAHTHLIDCFDDTPRLILSSPEKQSGKTRTLEVLELLVPAPELCISPSAPVLFRIIGAAHNKKTSGLLPTILLDEYDTVFLGVATERSEDLRSLVNAGHRRGATVPRCDGPTHQPIEHLAALRAIPNLSVVRPGDPNETAYAWRSIIARGNGSGPVGFVLTRQGIPVLEGTDSDGVARGGYVLGGGSAQADVILITTGSELQIAVEAKKMLADKNITAAVVSMPCIEWFESQPQDYRDSVLPPTVSARVAVEAGIAQSWYKLVGDCGEIVSIEHYGESADDKTLFREFGFTPEAVVAAAERTMAN